MKTDIVGRVRNTLLPTSKPLLPVYEAVVNSIQSIEDSNKKGEIKIEVKRKNGLFHNESPELSEIIGFKITDNGVGFNDENYVAFDTSDTTYKAKRGGKGIGRFLWLKAFDRVEIQSHYVEGKRMAFRSFNFLPTAEGIESPKKKSSNEITPKTIVTLDNYRTKYQDECPKRIGTISTHLIEHLLEYFIHPNCPQIYLLDQSTSESIDLNDFFKKHIAVNSVKEKIPIKNKNFDILHVQLQSSIVKDHLIHFCADSRVVKSEKLLGKIPNLSRTLTDKNGKEFIYAVYVESNVLNESVNMERTNFSIAEGDDELLKTITWSDIYLEVLNSCKAFLKPSTDPIRKKKEDRLKEFISGDGAAYRPILKHVQNSIDFIEPEITDSQLDQKLYQAYTEFQASLRSEGQKLMMEDPKEDDWGEFQNKLNEYFSKITDINKSELARYVCQRRAILEFLNKQLSISENHKYPKEERIHQLIFPKGKTSDDVLFENHNLWVLDEKLVYHSFLSSDKSLSSNPEIKTGSKKEPDILILDRACAFIPTKDIPFSSISIIEFKRAMRDDYTEKENPFSQICDYIDDIREGKAVQPDGRPVRIGENVPFYCYVICDITKSLEKFALRNELSFTSDKEGFFGYKRHHNAYFEVISYQKLLNEAKKRNAAFFNKLGLP